MTDAEVGDRVRLARLARRKAQREIGAILGLDQSAIARIERGERSLRVVEALKLIDALNLPPTWFSDDEIRIPLAPQPSTKAEPTIAPKASAWSTDELAEAVRAVLLAQREIVRARTGRSSGKRARSPLAGS